MMKRMYFAETKDESMFNQMPKRESLFVKNRRSRYLVANEMPDHLKGTSFKKVVKKHKYINLHNPDKILLFFHHFCPPCLSKFSCWSKKERMMRLYLKGSNKLYNNLNVFKILKRINELTLIVY